MHPILELSFVLQGFPIAKARKELSAVQNLDAQSLMARNQKAIWDTFDYHVRNNPTYSEFVKDLK